MCIVSLMQSLNREEFLYFTHVLFISGSNVVFAAGVIPSTIIYASYKIVII